MSWMHNFSIKRMMEHNKRPNQTVLEEGAERKRVQPHTSKKQREVATYF